MASGKVRVLAGTVDQIFSSAGNGFILYALAVVSTLVEFGVLAMLFTLVAGAVGVLRGALGTPTLLASDTEPEQLRSEGRHAVAAAMSVGLCCAAVIAAVSWCLATPSGYILAAATPIVLAQDILRYVAIAVDRTPVATVWDGIWCAGAVAVFLGGGLMRHVFTPAVVLTVWAGFAAAAFLGLAVTLGIRPRFEGIMRWGRTGLGDRLRFGADAGLEQLGVLLLLVAVAGFIGAEASGALRGATAVLAPVAILSAAVPLVVIPQARRGGMSGPRTWSLLVKTGALTSLLGLAVGVAVWAVPERVGALVLGDTYHTARPVILVMAIEYAASTWLFTLSTYLRARGRSSAVLTLKSVHLGIALVVCTAIAAAARSAVPVAVGLAVVTAVLALAAAAVIRPWRAPRGSSVVSGGLAARRPLPEAGPGWPHVWAAWTVVALGVVVPGLLITTTARPDDLVWLGPAAVAAVAAIRFGQLVGRGERRLYEMTFWVFTYAFMGLAALAQVREHSWPLTVARADWGTVGPATAVVGLGVAAFLAGAALDRWRERSGRPSRTRAAETGPHGGIADDLSHRRVIALAVVAILFNLLYLSRLGFGQFLLTREQAYAGFVAVWGPGPVGIFARSFAGMALLVSVVALIRLRRIARVAPTPPGRGASALTMTLLIVALVLLADTMNPVSNARYLSGTAILGVLTALGFFSTRLRFRVLALSFVGGLVVLFPLADAFRYTPGGSVKASNPLQSLLSPDYDSFAQIGNALVVADRDGIVPGRQFLGVLLWWFPRSVWPDKPLDTGIYLAQARGYPFTNLSAPLWCEAFLNGGWICVLVVFLVLGWLFRRWDRRIEMQMRLVGMPGVLGCILPFYTLILLRGSLLQAMSYLTVIIGCHLAVKRYHGPPARLVRGLPETLAPESVPIGVRS
ncbi:hypothetical protein P0W64_01475 [Tsukamurella sp. 8F]|uniref:hypothetical protein n=1 Tax=unclassified Tsukamurella TaxID=2633480 RepID=UPI0023B91385|nr:MULTISPECIES: hypothetical protein [unclassified Tsukamurella]MDF0531092.1 hypothetical protein [Tsukamurella sp. 8J]MDF0585441.1 hypothetical protein [Tsukamurella sp. 8F]